MTIKIIDENTIYDGDKKIIFMERDLDLCSGCYFSPETNPSSECYLVPCSTSVDPVRHDSKNGFFIWDNQ